MSSTARFDARAVREALIARGGPTESGFVRYAYRPFDLRWLYWEADTKLLDEKRSEYRPHVFEGNLWIEAREREAKERFARGTLVRNLADNFGNGLSSFFPIWLRLGKDAIELEDSAAERQPNPKAGVHQDHQEQGPHERGDAAAKHQSSLQAANSSRTGPGGSGDGAAERQSNLNAALPKRQGPPQSDDRDPQRQPNLSPAAQKYLERLGMNVEDLFHHVLATLHDPAYRQANAGALRMEWPRIPLPGWPDLGTVTPGNAEVPPADESNANAREPETEPSGQVGAMEAGQALAQSAARGRQLAALLDPDKPVPGVTQAPLRLELAAIAVPATADGRNMAGDDFALTASWGHYGAGGAVMPGQGRAEERPYASEERAALEAAALGATTFDIHLNDRAHWRNVPAAVWSYRLGGYQVLKKWLSYREHSILGRPLLPEEVQHFIDTARRIAAMLLF